jgi:hypothetical protein
MEELINFITRNKSTHFNIKDAQKRRVAYHEGETVEQSIDALRSEYPELAEGKYTLHAWKGSKSAVIDKSFKKGELETLFPNTTMNHGSPATGTSLQAMLAAEREKGRLEALTEMRISKIEDFISDELKPIMKALKALAELDIEVLKQGIEALKNDDPDDDEDGIEKLEKFSRGISVVKGLMKTA